MPSNNEELEFSILKEKLACQGEKTAEFRRIVKLSLGFWTGAVVALLVACVASFILLLTSFSSSVLLAVFGASLGVLLLALGLSVNEYTKRESNFLCAIKRRPLGYLLRENFSTEAIVLFSLTAGGSLIFLAASIVLYFVIEGAGIMLLVMAAALLSSLALSVLAFRALVISKRFITENREIFYHRSSVFF